MDISPTTPHQFTSLPKEIRRSIWQMVLQEPQVITIYREDILYNSANGTPDPATTLYFTSRNPPPSITGVCSEAREEALEYYTRAFRAGTKPRYSYVNFEVDTIIMEDLHSYTVVEEDRMKIQHLVLFTYNFHFMYLEDLVHGEGAIMNMKALRELTFVSRDWSRKEGTLSTGEAILRGLFVNDSNRPKSWGIPKITCVGEGEEGSYGLVLDYFD